MIINLAISGCPLGCYLTASSIQTQKEREIMEDSLQNTKLKNYTEWESFRMQEPHWLYHWGISLIVSYYPFGASRGPQPVHWLVFMPFANIMDSPPSPIFQLLTALKNSAQRNIHSPDIHKTYHKRLNLFWLCACFEKWTPGPITVHQTAELFTEFPHHILPILQLLRFPNTENPCISSTLNGHDSEPYHNTDFNVAVSTSHLSDNRMSDWHRGCASN